ncbi:hypothetical protein B296_00033202 [Ensete ventricosum]|uniref:Uncharacterized protein n=1 Tax=Ensete ventricosum TaxID=4639 RepID=A0A426Y1L5_ENSVE|nr:hypothetical protein B296_00033202 [Ensete ventricosum]
MGAGAATLGVRTGTVALMRQLLWVGTAYARRPQGTAGHDTPARGDRQRPTHGQPCRLRRGSGDEEGSKERARASF